MRWYFVDEVAALVYRAPSTVHGLLAPHRARCRLVRRGEHPRLHLHVPEDVLRTVYKKVRGTDLPAA